MINDIIRSLVSASLGLAITLFGTLAFASPGVTDESVQSIRDLIDGLIDEGAPGYAVGVVIDDDIAFTHYAGLSNLDTPTPIDERTRFNIASVAKQYTALMVLELANSGQIDLQEDFRTYLPDAMPGIEQRVTVAQLLTHTSGIRDVYDLFFLTNATWYETDFDNRTAMGLLEAQTDLNFQPGTEHLYSNSNYILLAEVVAEVTGERFNAYADRFFAERGMTSTTARRRQGVIVPRLARAYGDYGSGWLENPDIANTQGDGFVFTTLPDQLHWERQIWGHEATLPAALIALSQRPLDGEYPGYGFGLEFGFFRGVPVTYHEGATGSYNAYTLRFPEQNVSIITMGNTNQVNAVALANQIATLIMSETLTDAPVYASRPGTAGEAISMDDVLGLYELKDGTFVRLTSRDGELYREIEWRDPVRLVREGVNIFAYETSPDLKLVLTRDDDQQVQFALYTPSVAPRVARFIEPTPEATSYPATVEGRFHNAETDTEIILQHVDGDEYRMVKNGRPRTLQMVGRDYLVWNSYRITVLRDEGGRAGGLSVDRNRIRNVAFTRTDIE